MVAVHLRCAAIFFAIMLENSGQIGTIGMIDNFDLTQITEPLQNWFDTHARVLPWRDQPSAYYVWISEIMLQQTRVEAVKPYFERFIRELPDVQALAECFISPRYLEYFSLQAPKGEEGMYLGFSHLHSFLSSIFGFGLAGILLTKYCPDPALFETQEAWEAASGNAHYIWYYFAAIGLIAAVALLLFAKITESIDKKKKAKV